MSDAAAPLQVRCKEGALRFEVRARPRASRSSVVGVREGALIVSLAAPPVDGEANEELIRFLASLLEARRPDMNLVLGANGRRKLLEVQGVALEALERRLGIRVEVRS